jgi:hypothetical protein
VRRVRVDRVSIVSGAAVAALGALVLVESSGGVDVSLGWAAVAVTAAVGLVLLVSGLAGGGEDRHD